MLHHFSFSLKGLKGNLYKALFTETECTRICIRMQVAMICGEFDRLQQSQPSHNRLVSGPDFRTDQSDMIVGTRSWIQTNKLRSPARSTIVIGSSDLSR